VTGHDIPYPVAKLEKHHLPDLDRVLHGVDRVLGRMPVMEPVETSAAYSANTRELVR